MLEAIVGPQLDNHLLEELKEVFPPRDPIPTDTMSQIMYSAGQKSVISWITDRLDEKRNN